MLQDAKRNKNQSSQETKDPVRGPELDNPKIKHKSCDTSTMYRRFAAST
jgi:hypothetical protein